MITGPQKYFGNFLATGILAPTIYSPGAAHMPEQSPSEPVIHFDVNEWDRSGDWVILRTHRTTYRIAVLIDPSHFTRQLVAIRQMSETYRNMPPSQFRRVIINGRVPLGEFSPVEITRIRSLADSLGLALDIQTISETTESPYEKSHNIFWLIDDDALCQRIVREMLAAGVPVELSEVD